MLFRSLANDDIFISYSRRDATTYVNGIADVLTQKGFSCFIDRLGTDADEGLPLMLLNKIRRATMFVVLCTEAAKHSTFVSQEIYEFAEAKGTTRMIIPVLFHPSLEESDWFPLIKGIAPESESEEALVTGNPANAVVSRIEK